MKVKDRCCITSYILIMQQFFLMYSVLKIKKKKNLLCKWRKTRRRCSFLCFNVASSVKTPNILDKFEQLL